MLWLAGTNRTSVLSSCLSSQWCAQCTCQNDSPDIKWRPDLRASPSLSSFPPDKILINFSPGWERGFGSKDESNVCACACEMTHNVPFCDSQASQFPSVASHTFPSQPACPLLQLIKSTLPCSCGPSRTASETQHLSSCRDDVWTDAADFEALLL